MSSAVDLRGAAAQTRSFKPDGRGLSVEHEDKKANEERDPESRDEMDDLDVTQQQAEDVKGGKRAGRWPSREV